MQVKPVNGNVSADVTTQDFLRKTALWLGTALIAGAMVCWVAANWPYAGKFQKLAGAQLILVLLTFAAGLTVARPDHNNRNLSAFALWLALACIGTGALLALQGQIYQTGADAWQLFLLWAVLLLPWLIGFHTVFIVVLSGILVNVGAALALADGRSVFSLWLPDANGDAWRCPVLAAFHGMAWWLVERYKDRLDDPWRLTPRLAAFGVLAWLFWGLLRLQLDGGSDAMAWLFVLLGLLVCVCIFMVYRNAPHFDLAMLSQAGLFVLGAVVVQCVAYARSEWMLIPLILLVVGLSVPMLQTLRRLHARHRLMQADIWAGADTPLASGLARHPGDDDNDDPWYINGFRLSVIWLLTLLLLLLMFLVFELDVDDVAPWAAMLTAACLGLRFLRPVMVREVAAAFASVALLSICWYWLRHAEDGPLAALALLLTGGVAYVVGRHWIFRQLCAVLVTAGVLYLTWPYAQDGWSSSAPVSTSEAAHLLVAVYWRMWLLATGTILCVVLWLRGATALNVMPLAWALASVVQVLAWLAPSHWAVVDPWSSPVGFFAQFLRVMFALLPALLLGGIWLRRPDMLPLRVGIGALIVLIVAGFGWMGAPGIVLALIWLLLGLVIRESGRTLTCRDGSSAGWEFWKTLGVVGLLIYLCRFYYDLDLSLLNKSGVLAAMGLWFLGAGWLLRDAVSAGKRMFCKREVAWLAAGLILILSVVNIDLYRKESLLAQGDTVILALAPVDPRSIFQGDYMALEFEVADDIHRVLDLPAAYGMPALQARALRHAGGYMWLRADDNGVHQVVAVSETLDGPVFRLVPSTDDARAPAQEFLMKFHPGPYGRPSVGVNAFFFTEGQAERFERARYGEFRVAKDGRYLLAGLRDAHLRALSR